jgi:hypothetical protein
MCGLHGPFCAIQRLQKNDQVGRHHGDAAVWSEHGGGCAPGVMRRHRCLVGQWSHARCGELVWRTFPRGVFGPELCVCSKRLLHAIERLHTRTQIKLPCSCSHTRYPDRHAITRACAHGSHRAHARTRCGWTVCVRLELKLDILPT